MGYYTTFYLSTDKNTPELDEYIKNNEDLYLQDVFHRGGLNCKWYEYEDDLKEVSKLFPDILFTLRGYGEEKGDIWVAYFKNGRCYQEKAKIIFEEFDENKLK